MNANAVSVANFVYTARHQMAYPMGLLCVGLAV
jgi:hypothetical protein